MPCSAWRSGCCSDGPWSNALPDAIISQLDVPWGTLVLYVVIAGVAGLVAAFFPAIRASRLNVLDAISYE